ncbi:MAG: hypothetical protein M3Z04_11960 [Chloroflexota bacterium]|nr:hypothetical protein [Chloroflexota bacterium]
MRRAQIGLGAVVGLLAAGLEQAGAGSHDYPLRLAWAAGRLVTPTPVSTALPTIAPMGDRPAVAPPAPTIA